MSTEQRARQQPGRKMGRQMGVWAATAVVTGEAISLGIFLTPAGMARSLGSPALLAAVWCGMAIVTLAGALCFTELAVRFPQAGGEYVYLRHGFGRRVAFLYGWMAAVVMYPGVAAALCVGLVPMFSRSFRFRGGWLLHCPRSSCSRWAQSILPERASRAAS